MNRSNDYGGKKRRLTREQIALIKRAKRRKRIISVAFLMLFLAVLITVAVWLISAFVPKGISGLFGATTAPEKEVVSTKAPDEADEEEKTIYVECEAQDIYKGKLLLVNRNYPYHFLDDMSQFIPVNGNSGTYYSAYTDDIVLQRQAIDAMQGWMQGFYQASGLSDILVYSGYRSNDDQQRIIDSYLKQRGQSYVNKYVSPVGYSEHHTGLALDIDIKTETGVTTFYGKDAYAWVTEHAPEYGFVQRYTQEKTEITGYNYESWHFRYIGIPNAMAMSQRSYCLEEYIDYVTLFSYETKHLQTTDAAGVRYEIYYFKAEGDGIQKIPVPKEAVKYEIDGDNKQGFIVTVQMPNGAQTT